MPVRKPKTKSRLALIVALAALLAAAALALTSRPAAGPEAVARTTAPQGVPAPHAPAASRSGGPAAPNAAPVANSQASAGMRAYIDPVTGQLREPEQEELAAAEAERSARSAAGPLAADSESPELDIPLAGGGVARPVGDDTLVYTVATIGADGTLQVEHAQGGASALSKVAAGGKRRGAASGEVRDDR